jgi:hypothetical protein
MVYGEPYPVAHVSQWTVQVGSCALMTGMVPQRNRQT